MSAAHRVCEWGEGCPAVELTYYDRLLQQAFSSSNMNAQIPCCTADAHFIRQRDQVLLAIEYEVCVCSVKMLPCFLAKLS
jgi:hypothetical protein